jgi:hypothetical protein
MAFVAPEKLHGRIEIALDEGGVRLASKHDAAYVPWTAVADVDLESHVLSSTRLALKPASGEPVRVPLDHRIDPLALQREIALQLAERRAASSKDLPPALGRAGRPLGEWLAPTAAGAHAYRTVDLDKELLADLLADEHAGVDARAFAAYALLASGADDDLLRATRAFVLRALPPLVVVAARFALGGAALVDDEILADAARFLPDADRQAAEQARTMRDADAESRVAAALERAKALALEAMRENASSPAAGSKLRRVTIGGAGDVRWVGRSWAL